MANDAGNPSKSFASSVVFGLLGAGLVYCGRRSKPGILSAIATTAGYSLITQAVSSTVITALKATES